MQPLLPGSKSSSTARPEPTSDSVDVADIVWTLRRQWRAVLGFVAVGVLGAAAVTLFAPRRFEGEATLLARAETSSGGGSILGRLGSVGNLMSGGGLIGLPSPFESELQVLRSRSVAARVVDSLQLQFSVRSPGGVPPAALFAASDLPGRFKPRKYRFERATDGSYAVQHGDSTYVFRPGVPGRLDVGGITLQNGPLPGSFTVKVYDREDAVTRLSDRLEANKAGGEVASIVYRGDDSLTAAQVPNLVVAYYLERRKTVDRGANQRRLEYVTGQYEATAAELAATERALRAYQESSGILDAQMVGSAWLEGAVALRESLTAVLVNEASIQAILDRARSGSISPRQIASYPAFLNGTAVSVLAGHLTELETERAKLLERRTEQDPEVLVLNQNIDSIESQIVGLGQAYAGSITEQRVGLTKQLDSLQKRLMQLPAAAERGGRLQRDVARLTTIFTALQAQLVEARLAAIGEGGEVRQIDSAVPPRKPAFPKPWLTMGIGTLGGLLAGMIAALFMGAFGRYLRDPREIERATGVATQRLDPSAPLLIAGAPTRTVLLVPLGARARVGPVAQRLAQTAAVRALHASILDLSNRNGNGVDPEGQPSRMIEKLERDGDMLVVQLPGLASDITYAALRENRPVVLVAEPGPVDRGILGNALETLARLGVPCAGVVVSGDGGRQLHA